MKLTIIAWTIVMSALIACGQAVTNPKKENADGVADQNASAITSWDGLSHRENAVVGITQSSAY